MAGRNYGIDFGTSNIKLLCETNGNILNEKNIIAIKNKTETFAVGNEAYEIFEKTPSNIRTVFPVKYGVISDIKNMEILFESFYKKINKQKTINGATFYIAVPTDVTNVEKRAFYGLIHDSKIKAKKIYYVEKTIADAVGLGIDIKNSNGNMIVNIGSETTEISVISQGGIIFSKIIRVAGLEFDQAIIQKLDKYKNLTVGNKTTEILKIKLADLDSKRIETMKIYGQSTVTGLPSEIEISSDLINEALEEPIQLIFKQIKGILERTPPEISKDILNNGIYLTGGSSNIRNIDKLLSDFLGVKVNKTVEPSETCVRGLKVIMSDSKYNKLRYIPKRNKNK